jgi:hypothetical protein
MKKHIVKALKWALSKFDRSPEQIAAWPFPVGQVSEDFEPRPKKKVIVPKASTRKKPAAKKAVAKKATKVAKKAKE